MCLLCLMLCKLHGEVDLSVLGTHHDTRGIFADGDKLVVDAALFEQRGGCAVQKHRRALEVKKQI